MLYKKNASTTLEQKLFENPTSEYRGTPFWAWNCHLDEETLLRQIEQLKEMGFGGFHMHVRSGMATDYLSEDFFNLIKICVEKAKREEMLAWLYDEDRWPSGAAGGLVTKEPCYRQRMLRFTPEVIGGAVSEEEARLTGKPCLVGKYRVELNEKGELLSYGSADGEADMPAEAEWFAYIVTPEEDGWYNRQTYIDTLSKEAVDRFISLTHEAYGREVGEDFGKTIPAIFTDEPQFALKETLDFAGSRQTVHIPWSPDFAEGFEETYGEGILDKLPELFWEKPSGAISKTRYRYHDFIAKRFTEAFAKNCGQWCLAHGIAFTGHMVAEPTLQSQTDSIGEAMRAYPHFGLPGIDMLCGRIELTTAKQAQSAVHQYGREGVMSELYGVTNWDFDFRGHKFHGDWQAALGVTVRVPHLAWVSMEGEAKRDYPASISYQSPWYKEYRYVEDHFARVNTAMTRGKPEVRVGVIHPVESFWLHFGPKENTADIRAQLDEQFQNLTQWLLTGLIDFDFISESLLPEQCGEITDKLQVGEMSYSVVVVPGCEMLRSTTMEILTAFKRRGGRVLFVGEAPKYIDVQPSEEGRHLYEKSMHIPFDRVSLLSALEDSQSIDIRNADGTRTDNLLYQMRVDGGDKWVFIAHHHDYQNSWMASPAANVVQSQPVKIRIQGEYTPLLYNTQYGTIEELPYRLKNGCTVLSHTLYAQDSLLLRLQPKSREGLADWHKPEIITGEITVKEKLAYALSEPNVLLLDMAEFSLDGGELEPMEELLRIDTLLKKRLKLRNDYAQPWVIQEKPIEHWVKLNFTVDSEIELSGVKLAIENPDKAKIKWNGETVTAQPDGYFTDCSIKTIPLTVLLKGKNRLEVTLPVGERTCMEWCYLLGAFGVKVDGCVKTVVPLPEKLSFGSVTAQGLPFYGASITYHTEITLPENGDAVIHVPDYKGALVRIAVDGADKGIIAYAPYDKLIRGLKAGRHTVSYTLFGNRHNSFGALHNNNLALTWFGPQAWHTEGDEWSYEYRLKEMGILSSPVIKLVKK